MTHSKTHDTYLKHTHFHIGQQRNGQSFSADPSRSFDPVNMFLLRAVHRTKPQCRDSSSNRMQLFDFHFLVEQNLQNINNNPCTIGRRIKD